MSFFVNFSFLKTRWKILVVYNLVFFGGILTTLVISVALLRPSLYTGWHPIVPDLFLNDGWLVLFVGIFVFDLVWNSLIFITLPGLAFFPLSCGFLAYRAFISGLLLYAQPTFLFLELLPLTLLEGEAYVIAAIAGTVVGASWVLPKRVYSGETGIRILALRKAAREVLGMYILVFILLFVATITETAIASIVIV